MKIIKDLVREIFLIVTYPFGRIFSLFFSIPATEPQQTVVMVERWFNNHPYHKLWKRYLEKEGFEVYIVNFPIYKGSFEESAVKLKEYIDSLSLNNIVLVGISSGAITSLLYLQHQNGWNNVQKFISLGAPFKGTPMAFFLSFTKSGRELLPINNFIKKLSNEEVINKDKIICLRSKFDEMVPGWSSVLNGVRTETIEVAGHNNFHLNSAETYSKVAELAKE